MIHQLFALCQQPTQNSRAFIFIVNADAEPNAAADMARLSLTMLFCLIIWFEGTLAVEVVYGILLVLMDVKEIFRFSRSK